MQGWEKRLDHTADQIPNRTTWLPNDSCLLNSQRNLALGTTGHLSSAGGSAWRKGCTKSIYFIVSSRMAGMVSWWSKTAWNSNWLGMWIGWTGCGELILVKDLMRESKYTATSASLAQIGVKNSIVQKAYRIARILGPKSHINWPFPPIPMPPIHQIKTNTINIK